MGNLMDNMNRIVSLNKPCPRIYSAVTFDNVFVKKIENINFQKNSIIRSKLSSKISRKIMKIYKYIGTALYCGFDIKTFEQFEVIFMKEKDIKNAIKKWEIIVKIFKKYVDKEFEEINRKDKEKNIDRSEWDFESNLVAVKKEPYIFFISYLVVNNFDFSPEEKDDDIIKEIINIYNNLKSD